MSRRILDTNVLIRWLTRDDEKKADAADRMFQRAADRQEPLFVADMVVAETVWVLTSHYKLKSSDVSQILGELLVTEGLTFENRDRLFDALHVYEDYHLDFIDAYLAATASHLHMGKVVSYDEDFDKIPGLKRVEPPA